MARGFDTTQDASAQALNIQAAGYDFVGRYLSRSGWKLIGHAEASVLKAAGLSVVLVYEDGPTNPAYFGSGRGSGDAARAVVQAAHLGAPANTAIYFAVDYDASAADVAGVITGYFRDVAAGLAAAAAAGQPLYALGVYGSGRTCSALRAAGLVQYAWQAQSTGWGGYNPAGPWDIVQGPAAVACTLSVDADSATGNFGAW